MPSPAPERPYQPHETTHEHPVVVAPDQSASTDGTAESNVGTGEHLATETATTGSVPIPMPVLGDFQVLAALGGGGMGTVYRAIQKSRRRMVALKVLARTMANRPGFGERFRREARALGGLDHPNIVRYFAAGEANGFVYLAMELVEGGSVATWLAKCDRFSPPDALFVAVETAKALQYAHGRGLIHRDVKPDNLLLASDGRVKLADLGLAKVADDTFAGDGLDLTRTGTGLGTPLYAAPEQIRDAKRADARSDLYALGCVLYHCLTGQPPFNGANLIEVVSQKEKGTFTPASRVVRSVPAKIDRVVVRLLAKDPDHRYQSADDLMQELDLLGLAAERPNFLKS